MDTTTGLSVYAAFRCPTSLHRYSCVGIYVVMYMHATECLVHYDRSIACTCYGALHLMKGTIIKIRQSAAASIIASL